MWLLYVVGGIFGLSLAVSVIERIRKIPVDVAEKERVEQLATDTRMRAAQLADRESQLARERARFENLKAEAATAMGTISREKALGFPWLANAYSEYMKLYDLRIAEELENRRVPARRAAEQIRATAAEKAALRRENRILREWCRYYEDLFPWLIDFQGEDLDEQIRQAQERRNVNEIEREQGEEPASLWLTEAEQTSQQLTRTEKFQRALDRYWLSRKTPWQIGRDYERYVGFRHEREGFKVTYSGIEDGLEDLGRDLICRKPSEVRTVQCKHWRRDRTLREKHVCQIFGTAAAYRREHAGEPGGLGGGEVTAWLYVSCEASPKAKEFASMLGVNLIDNLPLARYPAIKCNVSQRDGEKIYHLPFDQQYDRTLIEYEDECYVETVAEAEDLGFRRAFRWRGHAED
ncbi:MAG TPA: restriction endonuclease [Bryobacteraceae bacterium]